MLLQEASYCPLPKALISGVVVWYNSVMENPLGIWNHFKYVELKNVCCRDLAHLQRELSAAEG